MKLTEYKLKTWNKPSIKKSIRIQDIRVILLKQSTLVMPPKEGSRNMLALDDENNILWIAELPKSYPMWATYGDMEIRNGLLVAWCGSTYCTINIQSGKVLSEEFVK